MSDEKRPREDGERPTLKITDRRFSAQEEAPANSGGSDPDGSDPGAVTADPGDGEQTTAADELDRARSQASEYLDHLRRLQAEFDNYRKRVLKEQTRAVELAGEPVVRRLLDVVDDFDLAMLAAEEKPDFEMFHKGVELVYAKLADALKSVGVERIDALGKPFDPEEHEALMQTGDGDGEPIVAEVLRPGYRLNRHVLRPAGVRVSRP